MNDYQFGNFICMLRENKGLTQHDVANMLGLTPAAVSKWENGSSKPRVKVLFQLADILGVSAKELMAGRFLTEEPIDAEAVKRINERYEYLVKIDSYESTDVKLSRLISSMIDFFITVALVFITASIVYELTTAANLDSEKQAVTCIICMMLTSLLFLGLRDLIGLSRSFGKRIMGMVILNKTTGEKANFKQILSRNAITIAFLSVFPLFLGIDTIIMLVRGQSVGDSLANTVVVKKERNRKNTNKKCSITEATEENCNAEQSNIPPADIELQKINDYVSPPRFNKKFIIGLISVIVAIIVTVIGLLVFYFTKYDSYEIVNTDITKYIDDCTMCKDDCHISKRALNFMPPLNTLKDYTDLFYSHKTNVYSNFMGFVSDGWALFVQYDESVYEIKKVELLNSNTFLDAPVISISGNYEIPVTEFYYKNYHMKIIPDENYIDFCACRSFALIGFDDESKSIVYCYQYDFDLDLIAVPGDDLEAEMCGFMDTVFEWKSDDVPIDSPASDKIEYTANSSDIQSSASPIKRPDFFIVRSFFYLLF